MARKAREIVKLVKEYVLSQTKNDPKKWVELHTKTICQQWEIPLYLSRYVLSLMRIDPELRYHYILTASRFKPKKTRFGTPEEKLKDLQTQQQFEMLSEEEKFVKSRLAEYINVNNLEMFYILASICETLRIKGFHQDWVVLNIGDISKLFECSDTDTMRYLAILEEKQLLVSSPISMTYKLILSESGLEKAESEKNQMLESNDIILSGRNNMDIIQKDDSYFTELKELESLRQNTKDILEYHSKIGNLIFKQLQLFDILSYRDEQIKKQKIIVSRLNEAYNDINGKYEQLLAANKELSSKYKALSQLVDDRTNHINGAMDLLSNDINALINEYLFLPTYKKNDELVSAKLKRDINKAIIKYTENAINYKKEQNFD